MLLVHCQFANANTKEHYIVGDKITLQSKVLNEARELFIYTPEDYSAQNRYPVIYVLDGEYYFISTLGIVNALTATKKIPDAIVVAIKTSIRVRDFLPPIDDKPLSPQQEWTQKKFPRFGGTEKFRQFLQQELFPYIDKHYATQPNKTLIGHSNGGVFVLDTLLKQPKLFTNYLAISPAPWWGDQQIDSLFTQAIKSSPAVNLYLSIADEGNKFYAHSQRIAANLASTHSKQLNWQYQHFAEEDHQSTIYPSIYQGLSKLFADFYYQDIQAVGQLGELDDVINYYQTLSTRYNYNIKIPTSVLSELATLQLNHDRNDQAFVTLNYFIEQYPNTAYAHQNLAFAYMRTQQFSLAKTSFEKALTILSQQDDVSYTVIDFVKDMIAQADSKITK